MNTQQTSENIFTYFTVNDKNILLVQHKDIVELKNVAHGQVLPSKT